MNLIIASLINIFDIFVGIIILYSMIRCSAKGFILSLLSFSKWLISLVITIIFVPKLNPWVQNYIESKFIADIGLGIFIFIISLFVIINISKAISSAVTWSGLGTVDKTFGLVFGIFKGYIISICLFSLFNWFYPYQNWGISAENAVSFDIVKKGSEILIEEFPSSEDFIDTKDKIEKI